MNQGFTRVPNGLVRKQNDDFDVKVGLIVERYFQRLKKIPRKNSRHVSRTEEGKNSNKTEGQCYVGMVISQLIVQLTKTK